MRTTALGLLLCTGLACSDEGRPRSTIDISNVMAEDAQVLAPMDARASDSAALDSGAPGPRCPRMWVDCAGSAPEWSVIAEASQFGADASFEALAGDLVLVRGGAVPWRVVRFGPEVSATIAGSVTSFGFPPGSWNPLGLARTNGEAAGVVVLACDAARAHCALLEAPLRVAGTLRESDALPADFVASGLRAASPALCAFGSGIVCRDRGVWTRSLSLPAGEQVVALALTTPRSLALTSSGRVFSGALAVEQALPVWVEQAQVAGVTQLDVAATRALFHGVNTLVERTQERDTVCELPAGVAAAFLSLGGARRSVLTNDGDLLTSPDGTGGYCRSGQVSLATPVRAASSGPCGEDGDLRVITATQLIGDNACMLD